MNAPGELAGRTVVVTRATDQAGTLRTMLEARGATVIEVALLRIADPADGGAALAAAVADPDRFDWIVVSSVNGAARLAAALGRRAVAARFAAVGRATAEALGRPVELVPDRQVAEGLLAVFPPGPGRVLVVRGDQARPVLAEGLAALGWEVETVEAYRTVPAEVPPELRAAVAAADVVTFASGSAVRAFVSAFGLPDGSLRTVSIGPVTSAVAAELGLRIDATAREHSLAGLVTSTAEGLIPRGDGER